ncbi:hypothetical protein CIK81_17055, partial [Brachybacterium sp. JB7]
RGAAPERHAPEHAEDALRSPDHRDAGAGAVGGAGAAGAGAAAAPGAGDRDAYGRGTHDTRETRETRDAAASREGREGREGRGAQEPLAPREDRGEPIERDRSGHPGADAAGAAGVGAAGAGAAAASPREESIGRDRRAEQAPAGDGPRQGEPLDEETLRDRVPANDDAASAQGRGETAGARERRGPRAAVPPAQQADRPVQRSAPTDAGVPATGAHAGSPAAGAGAGAGDRSRSRSRGRSPPRARDAEAARFGEQPGQPSPYGAGQYGAEPAEFQQDGYDEHIRTVNPDDSRQPHEGRPLTPDDGGQTEPRFEDADGNVPPNAPEFRDPRGENPQRGRHAGSQGVEGEHLDDGERQDEDGPDLRG